MAKTPWSFGRSECNRVNKAVVLTDKFTLERLVLTAEIVNESSDLTIIKLNNFFYFQW